MHLVLGVWGCTRAGGAPTRLACFFFAMKTSLYFKKKQLFNVTVGLDRRLSLVRSLLVCVRYSPAGMT